MSTKKGSGGDRPPAAPPPTQRRAVTVPPAPKRPQVRPIGSVTPPPPRIRPLSTKPGGMPSVAPKTAAPKPSTAPRASIPAKAAAATPRARAPSFTDIEAPTMPGREPGDAFPDDDVTTVMDRSAFDAGVLSGKPSKASKPQRPSIDLVPREGETEGTLVMAEAPRHPSQPPPNERTMTMSRGSLGPPAQPSRSRHVPPSFPPPAPRPAAGSPAWTSRPATVPPPAVRAPYGGSLPPVAPQTHSRPLSEAAPGVVYGKLGQQPPVATPAPPTVDLRRRAAAASRALPTKPSYQGRTAVPDLVGLVLFAAPLAFATAALAALSFL